MKPAAVITCLVLATALPQRAAHATDAPPPRADHRARTAPSDQDSDAESMRALVVLVGIPVTLYLAWTVIRIRRRRRKPDVDALVRQLGRNMTPDQQRQLRDDLNRTGGKRGA